MRSLYQPSSQGIYVPAGGGTGGSGVSSIIAGPGISVNQATGAVTITNTGIAGPATIDKFTNNSGNTTVSPTSGNEISIATIGGAARTSVIIADVSGRSNGDTLRFRLIQPAVAGIVEEIRNGTAGGTLIYSYTTDGSGTDNGSFNLYFDTGAWHPLANVNPVV